ncbi:hypothetical protein H6P81_000316 [Aristolochia fimbriata]|uniref:Uncharacterized protein n=1 Tax=Aristolochia fimbriata TaxID=158543 RepID=A0AAV7F8A6_ARIFI|nr:hypothetical protein H6P81_000316 [Aristolochia fimbriata]
MEGHPCDPASTNWTFAFFEEVHEEDAEDQSGYFFRLDAKTGVPMRREFPLIINLGNWTNVGFSSNGYLFYRSCVDSFAHRSPIPYRCCVANYFTKQTMVIPSPPELIGDIHYSVVGLGMSWFDNIIYSEVPPSSSSFSDHCCWKLVAVLRSDRTQNGKRVRRSFGEEGFVRVGTFDPQTGAWTTEPAKFSDGFKPFKRDYPEFFYLYSRPLCVGDEAVYWVHYWKETSPCNPLYTRHPHNNIWCRDPPHTRKGDRVSDDGYFEWKHCDEVSKKVSDPDPYLEFIYRPPCLVKLRLKTNMFQIVPMPLPDKRNVGLLR